ncbi:MAG: hypothetical protein JO272_12615 [Pseudonocardiales bacterium]|nr:hypothetical protein [Pseudonocardiales bacterium]
MNTLNTPVTRTASGVTRRNARNRGKCPRCHQVGTLNSDSIVCDRCASTRPPTTITVTVAVTLALLGGGR